MSQQSVEDELRDAIGELAGAVGSLHRAVVALDRARDAAAASGKPTDNYQSLRAEIETLMTFIPEQVIDIIRKMAEDEAGSRG